VAEHIPSWSTPSSCRPRPPGPLTAHSARYLRPAW
jgi:hypothetical protein